MKMSAFVLLRRGSPERLKVSPRKFTSGSSLQIAFKTASLRFGSKRHRTFDFPWFVLRRMWTFSAIMFGQSRSEVARYADVMRFVIRHANKYVDVVEVINRSHRGCVAMMRD